MWGLSQAQAAATLATVLVGVRVGLFPQTVFNGAILMILFTAVTSSIIVKKFGAKLEPEAPAVELKTRFSKILVPIANPKTQEHLITLASILARTGRGILHPIHVLQEVQGRVHGVENQRRLFEAEILKDPETDIRPIGRVDTSPARGIILAAIEKQVTLIVMGWSGKPAFQQAIFGNLLDEVIWKASVPVLVGRLNTPINALTRVVLVAPSNSLTKPLIQQTIDMVVAIARAVNVPLYILSDNHYCGVFENYLRDLRINHPYQIEEIEDNLVRCVTKKVNSHDMIVVTSTGSPSRFRSSLGSIPEKLAHIKEGPIVMIHYP
jgi:nucleotide-binding universal stress UspA family protein